MGRNFLKTIFVLLVLASIYLTAENREETKQAEFISVVDGDTIKLRIANQVETVRLIGIDAPETKYNAQVRYLNQRHGLTTNLHLQLGRNSKEFISKLLKNVKFLKYEIDSEERDQYGRLLAYVYLDDDTMLNKQMIVTGNAKIFRDRFNRLHLNEFEKLEKTAQNAKLGIWQHLN